MNPVREESPQSGDFFRSRIVRSLNLQRQLPHPTTQDTNILRPENLIPGNQANAILICVTKWQF